jgi:hypothetical protein
MAGDVGQRLLHQAIEMGLARQRQARQLFAQLQVAANALRLLPVGGQLLQCRAEFQALQHHRVEITDQAAKALLQALTVVVEQARGVLHLLRPISDHLEQAGLGANATEVLAEVVMQGLAKARALTLLQLQQRLGQLGVVRLHLL